ncbi:MAG: sensor histidine kinase [Candidatus Binatia bacterium]
MRRLPSLKPSGLLTRLLAPYLFTLLAVAVSLYAYSDRAVEHLYVNTLADTVLRQARLVGELLPWDLRGEAMDRRCAVVAAAVGARVTVIASDGTVLGDSEAASATLENHRDRAEVRAALAKGEGRSVRVSASVSRRLFYRAWRQTRRDDGQTEQRVVRLSVSMSTIDATRGRIRAAIWGGLGLAALAALWPALVLSRRLSRRVSRLTEFSNAVAAGAPPPPLLPEGEDIIGRLETNLVAMADSLSARLQTAREEQGKLEAVLSGMLEGVLVIDRVGTIRLANQRAERLFGGWPTGGLVGQPLINVSRDPDLQELVREVTRGERGRRLVREIGSRDESLQATATPIAEPAGEPRLFILVFHDVTELKKLESARRDFVANVSHELRTPLTAIRGYAETLRERALNDPEQGRKFLSIIERHAERLTRLTDDLLTLSDLELGRAALRRLPTALVQTVDAAVDVLREKAEQGRVEIRSDLAPDLPPIWGDPDRIEQVLVNLIDNAVKFTPAGGQVTISAHVAEALRTDGAERASGETQGRWIAFCVADTGVGVPRQHLHRLTERFYRVDQARSRELGGTGLGLAIVKHIVQVHGGSLRIESEVGHGTQVYVYLPVADAKP